MAFDEKTKAELRRLYVFDCMPLELAAKKIAISLNTARRWKQQAEDKGDNWDKARDVQTMAGGRIEDVARGLLTNFVLQFDAVMQEVKNAEDLTAKEKALLLSGLGDSFTKMTAASKRIVPDVSELATAIKTIKLLGEFIQANKPHLLTDFLDLLDGFAATLDKEFKA